MDGLQKSKLWESIASIDFLLGIFMQNFVQPFEESLHI